MAIAEPVSRPIPISGNPQWYKEAIIYQLHVRAFYDSNADGIGDFRGLTEKLDYLQELGITAIWLLPFYPSPLKDDGYDIADYRNVHPDYGTLRDFRIFLREAHRRKLRVITELVINHTSDQHPWFRRARRAPAGSRWRDYYVWSDTPEKYRDARIIFKDFEASNWSWDHIAQAYYWHRFYSHQPDLNFDNPEVRRAVFQTMDHWLEMGVDGLRLDAIPYLFERDGTNCENLPETHDFLKSLRSHVDSRFQGRMLLAEANQWPEDAVAYFGDDDECHAAFHFPLMPRMYMAVHTEDRFALIDILNQTPPIPPSAQWFLFLRNHDELTLEMVTDEERDTMLRAYARNPRARINLGIRHRLAPLMGNNRQKVELLNGLLMTLPGTPVIYYGDEIGMGDNIYLGDRNGVRTPMQWSADRNAGFSSGNPQQLYLPPIIDFEYHYETINVETQRKNPNSLLSWMKRLIAMRKHSKALTCGTLEFLYPENTKVLAFLRRCEDDIVMVVANLSRFAQFVELDLRQFEGSTPVEMFGHIQFPRIGELPYLLTLTPHSLFLFGIRQPRSISDQPPESIGIWNSPQAELPVLHVSGDWDEVIKGPDRQALERLLPVFLCSRRWFGGKAKTIQSTRIVDAIAMSPTAAELEAYLLLVQIEYAEAEADMYLVPLAFGSEERLQWTDTAATKSIIARLQVEHGGSRTTGILFDPMGEEEFSEALLDLIGARRVLSGWSGKVIGRPGRSFRRLRGPESEPIPSQAFRGEQTNSTVLFGQRLLMKIYRRLEAGVNPDVEISAHLTDVVNFSSIPPLAGTIEYRTDRHQVRTIGLLQGFVANEGNAWDFALDSLRGYFEKILGDALLAEPPEEDCPRGTLLELCKAEVPQTAQRLFGGFLQSAELLGRRTAELHIALSVDTNDAAFSPEPFSRLYQRSLYQGVRNQTTRALDLLARRAESLQVETRSAAQALLARRDEIFRHLRGIVDRGITATRIRCHGDYHLGQVLYTGNDFVIIDFEGEPTRPISERRIKTTPFRDVAGMLRSFDYACHAALEAQLSGMVVQERDYAILDRWVRLWVGWTSAAFLKSYLTVSGDAAYIPRPREAVQALLELYLIDKALYELQYELNNRPDWAHIPIKGLQRILEGEK